MTISKVGFLRLLVIGVFMLLLLNIWLNYFTYKSDESGAASHFSRLNIRKAYKYARLQNYTTNGRVLTPPALRTQSDLRVERNSSAVMNPNLTAIFNGNGNGSLNTSTDQIILELINSNNNNTNQHKYFTSATLDLHNNNNSTVPTGAVAKVATRLVQLPLSECKPPSLEDRGPITPNVTIESLDIVEAELGPLLKPGGAYEPHDCIAKDHVAIVVPFRDRYAHLSVFLRNIHPFLMKQHIAYRIFIVEQTNGRAFNRAALMNIGFLEALKMYKWDCFIFHDADLIPLDERNLYNCPRQPRHMSVAIDKMNYKLPYHSIFGGVSAMTREHFQSVNGFSNSFFGWGGEDDDMSNRLKHANLFISRYPINIARYKMLKHQQEKANPKRYENLVNGIAKMELDGINSIKYDIYSIKEFRIFTWYLAELKIIDQKS